MIKRIIKYIAMLFPDPFKKWVYLVAGGKRYMVSFRENMFKGIYDVNFYIDGDDVSFNMAGLNAYPNLFEVVFQTFLMAFLHLKARFKCRQLRLRSR